MNRFLILACLSLFAMLPEGMPYCKDVRILPVDEPTDYFGSFLPFTDTIFQIDTVYQYVIVYDTIFYDDLPVEIDTLAVSDTLIANTDSVVVIRNRLILNLKERWRLYVNQANSFDINPQREFEEMPNSTLHKPEVPINSPDQEGSEIKRQLNTSSEPTHEKESTLNLGFIPVYIRDTIVFFDTIINRELVLDTIFIENNNHNQDTTVLHYTDFEKKGKRVIATQTVKYTIQQHQTVLEEVNTNAFVQKDIPSINARTSRTNGKFATPNNKRRRKDSTFASREIPEKDTKTTTLLNGGFSVFFPSVAFSPQQKEHENYIDYLNENTQNLTSWGTTLTYSDLRNRMGYETGLGFSKTNFLFNHTYNEEDIDTTFYWQYFQIDSYQYDTTWYINIDTLLQTGDTLLIPNVDSTLFQITDSIQQAEYDTILKAKYAGYNCSFTYLEIPLNGRYMLFDGKFSAFLVAGVIPSFLISKTGKLPVYEVGVMVETKDITYEYGFNLSGYGAVTLHYNLHDGFSVFAEPFIRRILISTMKNDQFVYKSNSWGVKFGVSYTLFSRKHNKFR